LRLLLAALVLYNHSCALISGGGEQFYQIELVSRLTRLHLASGDLAVDGFFVISGFPITHSWLSSPSLRRFLWKRALRIYPAFLVVAVMCLLVFGPLAAAGPVGRLFSLRSLEAFSLRCLTLQEIKLDTVLAGPFARAIDLSTWTTRYEFVCYLGVATLGLTGLFRCRALTLALFGAWLVLYELEGHGFSLFGSRGSHSPSHALPRLGEFFLAGMCLYVYRDRIPRARRLFWISVAVLIGCMSWGHGVEIALPVFGTYALLYIAFWRNSNLTKFGRHGDFSYGTYLYAFPIQHLLVRYIYRSLNLYTMMLWAAPITALFAWASWRFVEEPCLKLKPR
jgi:peptidoglycan/LPS O-acetylase OafA/YrhL